MHVITTTGFYGTGSSAITDLFSEYSNIYCRGDFEIRIAFDPYGISDLEYNLIENPNRNNSSNALKKFIHIVDHLHGGLFRQNYEKYFNGKFKQISLEYVNDLVEFKYYGRWHYDLIERGELIFFIDRSYNKVCSIIKHLMKSDSSINHSLLSEKEQAYGTTMDRDAFLKATRRYFNKLFAEVNQENREYLMVDQLVQSSNIARYEKYFDDIKVFVVDRDPRDIYLLEKYVWKGHTVPYYDIEIFCKWFLWTRKQYEDSSKGNSLKIQFEDLIYHYDETVQKIEKHVGIDPLYHTAPKTKLIPEVSKENTQLWKKYKDPAIDIIEERLCGYCYSEF